MAKLQPLGDRVVVKAAAQEEVTRGGLVLPGTAQEKPQEGDVVAVGPGRILDSGERCKMEVKQGDRVVYAKYAGTEFKLDDEELLILSERDLLAVLAK
jgi:chaperonin GroES